RYCVDSTRQVGRRWMQVAVASRLGDLTGHFMAQQVRQLPGKLQEMRQIDTGLDTHFLAHIHQILGADIPGCTRCERATTEATEGRIKAPRPSLIRCQDIAQAKASSVMKVQ